MTPPHGGLAKHRRDDGALATCTHHNCCGWCFTRRSAPLRLASVPVANVRPTPSTDHQRDQTSTSPVGLPHQSGCLGPAQASLAEHTRMAVLSATMLCLLLRQVKPPPARLGKIASGCGRSSVCQASPVSSEMATSHQCPPRRR